jgi:hypothetical protein
MKFGQMALFLLSFFFLLSFLCKPTRRRTPAGYHSFSLYSLSHPSPSPCPIAPGHKGWEEPENFLGRSSPFIFSSLSAIEHPQLESTATTTSPPDPSTQRETSPYLTSPSLTHRYRQSADRCSKASRRSHRPTLRHLTPLTTSTLNQ